MIAPRFFGDDVLESCLAGHRMFDGSGDPPESVAVIQQALADLGFTVSVNGIFDAETGAAVTAFKTEKGLVPNDPVVGPGTMAALDADFAHELFDGKAAELTGTRFDLGVRTGSRVDIIDGFAICPFENGACVEIGHVVVYAMPSAALIAWTAAGGLDGTFGVPTSDPFELDANRSAQPFTFVVHVFDPGEGFTLPLATWEASIAGRAFVGKPLEPPQPFGDGGTTFVPHESGVVLAVPGESPQPLPQAVFDLWSQQEAAGASLGPPTAFAFPVDGRTAFPFRFGTVTLSDAGVVSVGPVSAILQRYFLPLDNDQHLVSRLTGSFATHLIGGDVALAKMRDDIASTGGPTDFIYFLNWHFDLDLELVPSDPTSRLHVVFGDRVRNGGVQLRGMFWAGGPAPNVQALPPIRDFEILQEKAHAVVNVPAVNFINGLGAAGHDAAAILDSRHRSFGSHHQKILVIGVGGKLVAYVGGIEFNKDRLLPVLSEPGSPLFDMSVRLEDAGAWLALQTFILRWTRHPNNFGAALRGGSIPMPLPAGGPLAVQMTHTYGVRFPLDIPIQTAATALANGIKNARQYFYMEDQYFVGSPRLGAAIRSALASNGALIGIVLLAAEDSVADLPGVAFRRRDFLRPIANNFPGQFLIFERLGSGSTTGPFAYVHSKLLIVDDEAAFIGSVNSNKRSWSHDTEVDVTIVDANGPGGEAPGTRGFARDLRCELWARHLRVPPVSLGNVVADIGLWRGVIVGTTTGSSVRPYDVGKSVQSTPSDFLWNNVWDPA
jgi:phosphatidylserine/phosphatidylglycerophosphate/cardiolipin synthase-like enzyme